jgi:hypothetical protein
MRKFENGQRIQVTPFTACTAPPPPTAAQQFLHGATGTVVRLLKRDNSAWVKMDIRPPDKLCPFPANDEHGRGNNILLYPEECKKFKG